MDDKLLSAVVAIVAIVVFVIAMEFFFALEEAVFTQLRRNS